MRYIKERWHDFKTCIATEIRRMQWSSKNVHNQTRIGVFTDIKKIEVGKDSYGILNVYTFGNSNEYLKIGNYVSIAHDVDFVLGGNHQTDKFSLFPISSKILKKGREATTKGPIIIEDEVWIGRSCIIMSGITIKKGAVIAAGSVVTKDVEAYSVVGGVPCIEIKKRFSKQLIVKLLENDLSLKNFNTNIIKENADYFIEPLTENTVEELVKLKVNNEYNK